MDDRLIGWPTSELVISNNGASVRSVSFSPDGQHIASGSEDNTIHVWNAMTGEKIPEPQDTGSVWSVAFSPDGQQIVSGSEDRTIRVWNAMTGETEAGPFFCHTSEVFSVSFSPDGQHIVSGSADGMVRVSNVTIGVSETTNDAVFTDHTVIDDEGWMGGSEGELLMWIPSVYRKSLHRPRTIWISGERETLLDLSNFVHGHSWAICINT